MKRSILIFSLSLLFFSGSLFLESSNCLGGVSFHYMDDDTSFEEESLDEKTEEKAC